MKSQVVSVITEAIQDKETQAVCCIGQIKKISREGIVFVDYENNPWAFPVQARILDGAIDSRGVKDALNATVLLLFENNDSKAPIIVGVVRDRIIQETLETELDRPAIQPEPNLPKELVVDNQKIILKGREEITLSCGKCSIQMKKNGRIILRGVEIVSRASQKNKVKGGVVSIN